MNCQYCTKEIKNKGSLVAHEMCCKNNPNKVKHNRSPNAGAKKGSKSWNAGKTFPLQVFELSKRMVESNTLQTLSEVSARRHAKKYLLYTIGNICSRCGIKEWMNEPVPLVCDHISGDSNDNRIENFRLVCYNCDAQLPTFKSKNKGKGRQYDREYRRNKSALNKQLK
jgi:hypothetical protein